MLDNINWQVVSFVGFCVINLVTILGLLTERAERNGALTIARTECLTKIQAIEQHIKDLGFRVGTLETGQDEWTKTLRERTHELSNQVGILVLKVDRLERPRGATA